MKNRITKRLAMLAVLCVMIMAFAAPALAASYSRVYGQTQDRVRVRTSASSSATIFDNIVKGACVYVTESKTSGGSTFVKVNYRNSDGEIGSGWVCQHDGKTTLVKILSNAQAKSAFSVENGTLPSKKVGTFTKAERNKALNAASSSSSSSGSSASSDSADTATVKNVQTMLKALGYYTGEITGNVGTKTKTAIQKFQREYDLTADGVIGPKTLTRLNAVYQDKKGTSSGSTSSSSSSGSSLKLGSSGTRVRNLQQDLTTLGYYWAEITGNFGSKTQTAVKTFQQKNNLTADGVAGTKTLVAISEAIARKGGSSVGTSTYPSGTVLKLDSTGAAVTQLQKDLKQLGYYYGDITGNFGTKTEAAVKEFQSDKKLMADGKAGTKTLQLIKEAIAAAGGSSSSADGGLKVGSTGAKVTALQQDLTALGYYYGDITGHYGSMTKAAVQRFQKAKGITQDGIAGTATLAAITKALGGSSSSSSGSALREGDSGSAVLELQTMLKELGFYYGDLTGNFGSLTKTAVRKFQDAQSLTVDGVAGTRTISLLRSMTGRGSSSGSSTGSITSSNVAEDDSFFLINKDGVRLRTTYSLTSAAKTTMDKGDPVQASKRYNVGGTIWYYITYKDGSKVYSGYVRGTVLNNVSRQTFINNGGNINVEEASTEILGMIRVTANNVSIREEADSSSKKVDTANKGDLFYYVDKVGSWYQIKTGYWIKDTYAVVLSDQEANDYISGDISGNTYRNGDTGSAVTWIQEALKKLGYYDGDISGHYGNKTEDAVREFQRDNGISADGIAGPKTNSKLMEEYSKKYSGSAGAAAYNPVVHNYHWFGANGSMSSKYSNVGLKRGAKATLTDIATGKTFNIVVQSTGSHADVEPATADDTKVLCSLYKVSSASQLVSENKYQRRAVVMTINGQQFVGSIYAIPHGKNTVSGNNFDGQFCVHFLGSKTHGTDRVDNDPNGHQEKIEAGVRTLRTITSSDGVNKVIVDTD